jgi:hypothetical protein
MNGMQMDGGDAWLLEPVIERVIGCAFRVANALGHGFVEKVYENALEFRPVQSRNPPCHSPSLIAITIPFIPAIPVIRLKK